MTSKSSETIGAASEKQAGKHLTFILGRESYGVPVLKVREITRMADIRTVPRMPDFVRG